jgi:hypothetical protein
MAESIASDGPAVEAMNALVRNEPMRKDIVDDISKGKVKAEKSDLIQAIRLGCDYWMTDPAIQQNNIFGACRDAIKTWQDGNMSEIDSRTDKYVLAYFRDLCTVTELMVENASKHGSDEHVQQLLHGHREVRNHPSKYQLDNKVFFGGHS